MDLLQSILRMLPLGPHGLPWQYNINFLLFSPVVGNDDSGTLPLLFQLKHQILRLPFLGIDDLFVLVEDGLGQKLPPGGLDGELGKVVGHEMRVVAEVPAVLNQGNVEQSWSYSEHITK